MLKKRYKECLQNHGTNYVVFLHIKINRKKELIFLFKVRFSNKSSLKNFQV